jgi:hypothetical protein
MNVLRRITCFLRGHRCYRTGRYSFLLEEWKCERCGKIYVAHGDFGSYLLPGDAESDALFRMWSDLNPPPPSSQDPPENVP